MGYEVPKVHSAILNILKELSVERSGSLPSNMGGGKYIPASGLFGEVKEKFAEKGLIFVPVENFQKHEVVQQGNRVLIATVIEGRYTVISTEDGSSLTIQGVGDGLATGSAVSSNIASTNALKNALLRFFFAAETSVEDKAKNGVGDGDTSSPAQQKIAKASGGTNAKAPAQGSADAKKQVQDKIKALWAERVKNDSSLSPMGYREWGTQFLGVKEASEWMTNVQQLEKVATALENGEA